MKIAILLPSLEMGGAERRMLLLAQGLKERGEAVEIVLLRRKGEFLENAEALSIAVRSINKGGRYDLLVPALRARRILGEYEAVISCLPSANLFSLVAKTLNKRKQPVLIWGVATASLPVAEYGLWARIGYGLQHRLSRFADRVVINSKAGIREAKEFGYRESKLRLIRNCVDLTVFHRDQDAGTSWKERHNIPVAKPLVAIVGRLDPVKGHLHFIEMAESLAQKNQDVCFAIIGGGEGQYARDVMHKIDSSNIRQRFTHIKYENDMPAALSAISVLVICSQAEGLPNSMIEALACAVPVVATDVGDCADVLDAFGGIVPSGDAAALLIEVESALKTDVEDRFRLREHASNYFSIEAMTCSYVELMKSRARSS